MIFWRLWKTDRQSSIETAVTSLRKIIEHQSGGRSRRKIRRSYLMPIGRGSLR